MIATIHLFPPLEQKLLELLRSLSPEEWEARTVAGKWTVKDVAAHLLDGSMRTLSMSRDKYFGEDPGPIHSHQELVQFLDRLNADWVQAMKRVSPSLLVSLLEITAMPFQQHLASLDPMGKALFAVGWAGEEESLNWFHIAREYTERWHHQQQIREAVNKPGIMTAGLYHPFLQTFMMALPYTYRHTQAPQGSLVTITITGEGGGSWHIIKKQQWEFTDSINRTPDAHTIIDGIIAWKLFSKSWRTRFWET
jgi:uncharacterized protein (TIGR03083 family)